MARFYLQIGCLKKLASSRELFCMQSTCMKPAELTKMYQDVA